MVFIRTFDAWPCTHSIKAVICSWQIDEAIIPLLRVKLMCLSYTSVDCKGYTTDLEMLRSLSDLLRLQTFFGPRKTLTDFWDFLRLFENFSDFFGAGIAARDASGTENANTAAFGSNKVRKRLKSLESLKKSQTVSEVCDSIAKSEKSLWSVSWSLTKFEISPNQLFTPCSQH